jgi:hypothetical protein
MDVEREILQGQLIDITMQPRRARPFLREPVGAIGEAARYLDEAVTAHLKGDFTRAEAGLRRADIPAIRAWRNSIWGGKQPPCSVYARARFSVTYFYSAASQTANADGIREECTAATGWISLSLLRDTRYSKRSSPTNCEIISADSILGTDQ